MNDLDPNSKPQSPASQPKQSLLRSSRNRFLFLLKVFLLICVSGFIGAVLGVTIPEISFGLGLHICAIVFVTSVLPAEALAGSLMAGLIAAVFRKSITDFRVPLIAAVLVLILNTVFVELEGCF